MLGMGADRDLPTVLLIDDDMVSREVIATLLTLTGYTLHTAADGEEALAKLHGKQCVPQVILVDVQMPGLHGLRLVEKLRAASTASIYTISASDPSDELKAATDGLLLKPFGPDALKKLLEQHATREAEVRPDPGEPVLSGEILTQFRQMMPEAAVRGVYAAVVSDLKTRGVALEAAVSQGNAAEVRRICEDRGIAVLVAEQNPEFVRSFADRVIVLSGGRVQLDSDLTDVSYAEVLEALGFAGRASVAEQDRDA